MSTSQIPISKTKILVPKRRRELLTRQRLLDALYKLIDRKLVLVTAPAGYGKTSLLIDLANHSELPYCWLALDPLDRKLQRFIAYFLAAITENFPKFGNHTISMLDAMTSLEKGVEPLLVTLVNEIYEDIPEHFILVLDDFHLVDDIEPILSFVNRFIQLVGENCHLILASRAQPQLPDLTLFVARGEAGLLDFSDLKFTTKEIQALLAQNQQISLSEHAAQQLIEDTEGWITGLQFTDSDLWLQGKLKNFSPRAARVNVFDYLGKQVLERQNESLRLFLLRSSLIDEFDINLCEAVLAPLYSKPQNWSKLIKTIIQKNLFALPVDPKGQWVRYHHLFRDYMRDRLSTERPNEVLPILQRLANFQESTGEWEKAYLSYKQIGDINALVGLIEHAGTPMYQHALVTLESWLVDLPSTISQKRPGVLSLRGAVESTKGNVSVGLTLFNRAISRYHKENNTHGLALALVRRGVAHRLLGNYKKAVRDAEEAMHLTKSSHELQWNYAEALRVKGLTLFRQGRTVQASNYLEKALNIYKQVNEIHAIPALLMETGMTKAAMGKYLETRKLYEEALSIWRETGDLAWQATLLNNLGSLYQQQGEYEQAVQIFDEGLLCAERSGNKRIEALISLSLGDLHCEVHDFEIAELNYQGASDLIQPLDELFLTNYLALAKTSMAILKKETGKALQILDRLSALIKKSDSAYEYGLYQLAYGRAFLQSGKFNKAKSSFLAAKRCFTRDGREMESVWGHVWLAAAYYQNGERSEAQKELELVLKRPGQVNHFTILAIAEAHKWLEGLQADAQVNSTMFNLFEKAVRLNNKLPLLRRQLRRVSRTVGAPRARLVIRAFGPAQVWVNGKLITRSVWQTQSVRILFFYLLMANQPATKEQIEDVLWPNTSEPAKLRLRFKNEVYRLRRAIGQDAILFVDNRYQFNSLVDHEYDIEDFEAYLAKANSASTDPEKIEFYQKAFELVRGPYLEDFDHTWVWPKREHLGQLFLSLCITLAELYLKEALLPKALLVCGRAIEYDETCEAAYRLTMKIYHRQGNMASIIHTYQALEQVLKKLIDLSPSSQTQSLYRDLIA